MNLFSLIKSIFAPAAKLIDAVHTSTEEKLAAKAAMLQVYVQFLEEGLKYESDQLKAKAAIIEAEAKSGNLLTSSWRPVTMYVFLAMLVSYWFGWTTVDLSPEVINDVFDLMKIGIGGYIGSRGVEKIIPPIMKAFKDKEQV